MTTQPSDDMVGTLQHELRLAQEVICLLMADVEYADAVFGETCDCGRCGPCRYRKTFVQHASDAKDAITRIKLAQQ